MKTNFILKVASILLFCGILNISCEKDPVVNNPIGPIDADPNVPDRPIPYNYADWMSNIDDSKYL